MVAANKIVREVEIHYSATGLDQVKAKADAFTRTQDGLAKSTDAVGGSEERVARRRTTMAEAQARLQRQNEQMLAMQQQVANSNGAVARSLDGLAKAQAGAVQGSAALTEAANDNVSALDRVGGAFRAVGEFAMKHPVLVLAGAALAARGLSSLAAVAGTALGTASATTASYAATSTAMGGAVAGAATVASRGLGAASTAATAASGGFAVLATRIAALTSPIGLVIVGVGLLVTALASVGSAFSDMGEKSEEIDRTSSKFAKLVELGRQAERLDLSGPFLRAFTGLGDKVDLETKQMQSAIEKASAFVRDEFEQTNKLRAKMTELEKLGYSGAEPFRAGAQLDLAADTEGRIRAALTLMGELEERGHRLAAINIAESVFGADFAEKLRTGQMTVKQFVEALDEAGGKQLLKQEDVQRALELSRAIEKTKREIMEVIDIRSDFSKIGVWINEWYLAGLQAIKSMIDYIAQSIRDLGAQFTQSSFFKNATWLLEKLGVKTSLTTDTSAPAQAAPAPTAIGSRVFPEMQGPKLPDTKHVKAAKEAQQSAHEAASAYELLIKRTQDRVKELDLETASVGGARDQVIKLKLAHDLERAALSSGVTVTKEMREEWDKLGDKLAGSTTRLEDSRRVLESTREAQREMAEEFATFAEDIMLGGEKIGDAFASLSKSFTSSTFKALLTGDGPLAGLYGTASTERGEVGGLLGGKLNLGSLFDTGEIGKALGSGAETGIGNALSEALKPQKTNGGFASSKLGGGLVASGAGAAIGYSSQSPLMGVLGGALAGSAMGPWGAVIGAGAGLIGGLFGKSQAKKEAEKKIREQLEAYKEAYKQAQPEIEKLRATFRGESLGSVGDSISGAFSQAVQANKTASQAGDQAGADRIMVEFVQYAERLRWQFIRSFEGTLAEVSKGLGTSGPFAQAAGAIAALGESLKGFVADALRLPDAEQNAARARVAARQSALASLDTPKALSATQAEMARIQGTAAGLAQVLIDLGLSADDAATAIRDRTASAMEALRASFDADVASKLNEATGRGYLNEAADLMKEIRQLGADQAAIGGDAGQVEAYFAAAAQKIVDGSELTGAAFDDLIRRFPDLQGRVHAFSAEIAQTAQEIAAAEEALAERRRSYQDRAFAAGNDTGTESGALAAFDRAAAQERIEETRAGGKAMADLEAALAAERLGIVRDFAARAAKEAQDAADAIADRVRGFADRAFAAGNDTSTLEGRLAAFDRHATQERQSEIKAGGQAILDLERAQSAERVGIIKDFGTQAAKAAQDAADAVTARARGFANRTFAAGNDSSTLEGQLAAFDRQARQEREQEIKAGGEAIVELETAQYAERTRIVQDFADKAAEAERQRMEAARQAFDTFARNIREFVAGLRTGAQSPLSPQQRLAAAQGQFQSQLALARTGDRDALNGITGNASSYLDAAKAYYASSERYQQIFQQITSQLEALPKQVSAEQFIVDAIDASKKAVVDATTLMQETLRTAVQANNPTAIATALTANFDKLDTSVDGLLDFEEFKAGLGPLATKEEQAAARLIFDRIDVNGDGQISKLELTRTTLKAALEANSPALIQRALSADFTKLDTTMDGRLDFDEFKAGLGPLATKAEQEAAKLLFQSMDANGDGVLDALELMRGQLVAGLEANSPTLTAKALDANFTKLDTSVNGLLDYQEFLAGLGPLATKGEQEAAKRIFDAIDANGDGQLSKLELVSASTAGTKTSVEATTKSVDNVVYHQVEQIGRDEKIRENLAAAIAANSPSLVAGALTANFDKVDTSVNGLLDYNEVVAALGPMATKAEQEAARSIFNAIDTNGDGQLDKLELVRARAAGIETQTGGTKTSVEANTTVANQQKAVLDSLNYFGDNQTRLLNSLETIQNAAKGTLSDSKTLLEAINNLSGLQKSQLELLNDQFAYSPFTSPNGVKLDNNLLTALNKIVFNTANVVQGQRSGAAWTYAAGGYVSGPGTGTSDSIPAWLSTGEFVMTAEATRRLGQPMLDAMNDNRFSMPTLAMPVPMAGGGGNEALIAEVRALRAEVAALRGEVRENTDVAEQGHVGTIGAVKRNTVAVQEGNAAVSRQALARKPKAA